LFNVNPVALRRVPRLYCRNERAIIHTRLEPSSESIVLVAVGAILVGSIELHGIQLPRQRDADGPVHLRCQASFHKGQELGYFHHGSTIIIVASEAVLREAGVREGCHVRMGERILRRR
jgi:phosphatidylserine decarboxylase